jgi:hypothetical protein
MRRVEQRPHLRQAATLPGILAASFDAFEVIRLLARVSEDTVPALFAAFMTAADAAVDGREAVTTAPSLPPGTGRKTGSNLPTAPQAKLYDPGLVRTLAHREPRTYRSGR